jgi:hypothetical protein
MRESHPAKQTAAIAAVHLRNRLFFSASIIPLFRQAIHFEVALRSNAKCVGNTIKESKHRRDVDCFGDLWFGPTVIPQFLHIFAGRAVRRLRDLGDVIKQSAFRRAQSCLIKVALSKRFYCLGFCSLNTQEVCMRVQSIWTAIEPRNPARDCFLGFTVQVALGEVDSITELHHLAQEVGAMAEAFQDTWHRLTAGFGPPFVIDLGDFAGCVWVFDELDLGFVVRHRYALLASISWQYITNSGRYASTRKGGAWLKDEPLIALNAGDTLAVQVFEQRYCILTG